MSDRVEPAGKPHGVVFELPDGVPEYELAAFQANASDDPEEVKAAKKRLEKRDGAPYSYDPETKLFERLPPLRVRAVKPPVVHVPERRAPVASPGEQGRRARRSSASSRGSPDDPDPEPPPPVETWRGFAAASVRMVQHCERRRAKWATA